MWVVGTVWTGRLHRSGRDADIGSRTLRTQWGSGWTGKRVDLGSLGQLSGLRLRSGAGQHRRHRVAHRHPRERPVEHAPGHQFYLRGGVLPAGSGADGVRGAAADAGARAACRGADPIGAPATGLALCGRLHGCRFRRPRSVPRAASALSFRQHRRLRDGFGDAGVPVVAARTAVETVRRLAAALLALAICRGVRPPAPRPVAYVTDRL
eukprot:ctg_2550.g582